jgi:serine/threonine protein kinase
MTAVRKPVRRAARQHEPPVDDELKNFVLLPELVGKGSYSNIWRARSLHHPNLSLVAKVSNKHAQRATSNFQGAVHVLGHLDHPNIIKLIGSRETTDNYYEFLEYLEKPALTLTELLKQAGNILEPTMIVRIFSQLVSAVAHMHARGFGHRDIKPDNIMVHPQSLHVTLIDFGFALPTESLCEDFSGSPIYAPPEILNFEAYSVDLADLWSLGVVLYQMCFGNYPYPAKDLQELTNKVNRDPIRFPPNLSGTLHDLTLIIKELMKKSPVDRLNAGQLNAAFNPNQVQEVPEPVQDSVDAMDIESEVNVVSSSLS